MLHRFRQAVIACTLSLFLSQSAWAQATLMPNAKQTFTGPTGAPLAAGTVDMYIPNTSTRKNTWKDSGQTQLNTNPINLDSAGRAQIYGLGNYRQVVKDVNGNPQWDALTASTVSSTATSASSGAGDFLPIGSIIPVSSFTLPLNYAYANGQTLDRTIYVDAFNALTITGTFACSSGSPAVNAISVTNINFHIGMPVESSCFPAGTTVLSLSGTPGALTATLSTNAVSSGTVSFRGFPWGNGNGSTTFNTPNLNGRAPIGPDTNGSTLPSTFFGGNPAWGAGATGGGAGHILLTSELPPYTPSGTNASSTVTDTRTWATGSVVISGITGAFAAGVGLGFGTSAVTPTGSAPTAAAQTWTGNPGGGSSVPFSLVQPSIVVTWIVKVFSGNLPTVGVVDIGGLTGDILCGGGLVCDLTTNTISVVGSSPLLQNYVYVGNPINQAVGVLMSGDCSIVSSGVVTCVGTGSASVTSYGGVLNDPTKTAVNATALAAACSANPRALIPAGHFYIAPPFSIPSQCKAIIGEGPGISFLEAPADDPIGQPPFITQANNLDLENITVGVPIGAGSITAGSHQKTWVTTATGATRFRNVQLYGSIPWDMGTAANVVGTNVEITSSLAFGVYASSRATNVTLTNLQLSDMTCTPSPPTGQQIAFEAPDGLTILGGRVGATCGNQSIVIFSKASDPHNFYPKNIVIDGMRITANFVEAIWLHEAHQITISNNVIVGGPSKDNGIGIYANDAGSGDPTLDTRDVTVTGNILTNIGATGIVVNINGVARGISVTGNSIKNPGSYATFTGDLGSSSGIGVSNGSNVVNVTGNTVLDDYFAQSVTSITIGTGDKTFNGVGTGLPYLNGDKLFIASRANPTVNNMVGTVKTGGYSGGNVTITISSVNGSGTFSDWNIGRMAYGILEASSSSGTNIGSNKVSGGVARDIKPGSPSSGGLNGRALVQGTGANSNNGTGLTIQNSENPVGWELRTINSGDLVGVLANNGITNGTLMFQYGIANNGTLSFGNTTSASTANPFALDLGGTFANSAGSAAKAKLKLLDDGVNIFGFGVSSGQMESLVAAGAQFTWYVGGTSVASLGSGGNINTIGNAALGANGGTIGALTLRGSTSGAAVITPQAVAGTPTLTIGTTSGTIAAAASAPIAINAVTGLTTCTTCATTTNGGALSGTSPVAISAGGAISITGAAGQVLAGSGPAFTATPTLGVAGSTVGSVAFANATSGSITVQPVTGALGSSVLSLPATTSTVAVTGNNLSAFASTTSAQLAGVLSDEVGTGKVMFNIAPTMTGEFVLTAPATGASNTFTIAAGGNTASDAAINRITALNGTVVWAQFGDASAGNFRQKSLGTYAFHAGNVGITATNQWLLLTTTGAIQLGDGTGIAHVSSIGAAAPAPTSCGTSPSVVGSDMAGTVTMGTGAPTGCVLTFQTSYAAAPHCTVTWRATPLASQSYAVTNTTITLTQTATSSNVVDYICIGG